MFDIQCGDAAAALGVSEPLVELTREHSMTLYHAHGSVHAAWAHTRLSDDDSLVTKLAQAVSAFTEHGAKLYLPFYQGLLAELGCERQSADLALTRIDDALALSEQTRQHWIYPFLQRVRGGILLKRRPRQPRACRGCIPERPRRREAARRAELRSASGACARQALPIHRPPRRRPRRPRASARRLLADARNAGDRPGASALAELAETEEVKAKRRSDSD